MAPLWGCARMALLLVKLRCALCGGPIDALGDFFRASGDFLPAKDPLIPFCNVPLHWSCYARWPERVRFAGLYVQAWVHVNRKNPFWWSVYQDERVYLSVNPERPVEEASVRLCAVGSDIRVPLRKWSAWVADADQVTPGLRLIEKQALAEVLPILRARFPNDHAVVHAINPAEKGAAKRRTAHAARSSGASAS
jgi:hypothetical protein